MSNSWTWAISAIVFAILFTGTDDDWSRFCCCVVIALGLSMMDRAARHERDSEASR